MIDKSTCNYQGKKFSQGKTEWTNDALVVEEGLQVKLNGQVFTLTMRTPGYDHELIRGLLHSEGILPRAYGGLELAFSNERGLCVADVTIADKDWKGSLVNSRNLISVSSCGICGKTSLEELIADAPESASSKSKQEGIILPEELTVFFDKMNLDQEAFRQTGGSHAAAAFDNSGVMYAHFEDIGRHNAVDKVIGSLILSKQLGQAEVLIVSGRISYEIVVKCFKARIPVLASVSAPSSLAVDYAKELGITLFSFCREGRATCYANAHRIKQKMSVKTR